MATKYSDIVKIRGGKANYNIAEERGGEWSSFISNDQFNDVLRTVLKSVRANNIDNHKSFWLNGTYGTGKSHAVSVISHLLCDETENVKDWVNREYSANKFEGLRSDIYDVKTKKRLLPVNIYGLNAMTHPEDLALILQRRVTETLQAHGIDISVTTDIETYINHINQLPGVWDQLIQENNSLSAIVSNREQLIKKLKTFDTNTFNRISGALRESKISIRLNNEKIGTWLLEVQSELRKQGVYKGLLILWDEFTDVMSSDIGLSALKILQEIAEMFANIENDSYFFLISHPSAYDKIGREEMKQTNGRYHCIKYNMEPVSAFKIMSRKFEIVNAKDYEGLYNEFYEQNYGLLDVFTQNSNNPTSTKEDMRHLFPLHPGTANLATHYATVVGSSSRSVFEFLGQNDAIENFLNNEDFYTNKDTITADYLWDYVLKVLQDDVAQYGPVTERYNLHFKQVTEAGEANLAIFKGILLLNAFNNISAENNNGLVTPSEENIRNLFTGSRYAGDIDEVLQWLNDENIIQRAPGQKGLYTVRFSALPSNEIENKKKEIKETQFKYTYKLFEFTKDSIVTSFKRTTQNIIRPYQYGIYSDIQNNATLRNQIKNGRKSTLDSNLYFAFLVSRNNGEKEKLQAFSKECIDYLDDESMRNIIFVVFDEVLSDAKYEQFIDYLANYECANSRGLMDQTNAHRNNAIGIVKDWVDSIYRGNATIYLRGVGQHTLSIRHLSGIVNATIIPYIYQYAPESCALLRTNAKTTFWNVQNSKEIVRNILSLTSLEDLSKMTAQMQPIRFLFQDCVENDLKWKQNTEEHPLRKICDEVDRIIKSAASMDTEFNINEKFAILSRPPYGLYKSYACMGAMAYALRPWINKIFDTQGKPLDAFALVDCIYILFDVWWDPKKSNKDLNVRFQTPDESELCKELVSLFNLKGHDFMEINSLTAARHAIVSDFLEKKNAPLWVIKYAPNLILHGCVKIELSDKIKHLIDNIVKICGDEDSRNQKLFQETTQLIKEFRIDMKNILNAESIFSEGFKGYLLQLKNVDIKEEEIEEVKKFIHEHLHSTVGYWTEEEVEKQALLYLVGKKSPTAPPPPPQSNPNPVPLPPKGSDTILNKREKAKERVDNIVSLSQAKEILKKVCEYADEQTIDIIIS